MDDEFVTPKPLIGFFLNPYHNRFLGYALSRGAVACAGRLGKRLVLSECLELFERFEGLEGLLAFSLDPGDDSAIAAYYDRGIPVMGLDEVAAGRIPAIVNDGESFFFDITRRLIESGHERIAFLGGEEDFWQNDLRLRGFRAAMAQAGLEPAGVVHADSWLFESAFRMLEGRFDFARPLDALVCANDGVAFAAIVHLRKAGWRVPEDVSVTGYDNFVFRGEFDPALFDPPLTNGNYPSFEMGWRAVEQVCAQAGGAAPADGLELVRSHPILRNSIRPGRDGPKAGDAPGQRFEEPAFATFTEIRGKLLENARSADDVLTSVRHTLRDAIRRGYNDFHGYGLLQALTNAAGARAGERLDEAWLAEILGELSATEIAANYRDFHLRLVHRRDLAIAEHVSTGAGIADRRDAVEVLDRLRRGLGIDSLCVECLEAPREVWLLAGSGPPRCFPPSEFGRLRPFLEENALFVKEVCDERGPIALLFTVYALEREIDAEPLVRAVAACLRQAKFTSLLNQRNRQLGLEKEKAFLARREADAANRAKSAFLATMSHEIRTPLNAVIGYASLLEEAPLDEEHREWLRTIARSGEDLLVLIKDILDYSKIEAGKVELESAAFDLPECVQGAVDLFAPNAADKNVEMACVFGPEVPRFVVGDVTRLRQIIVNLLGNALKFTEKGEISCGVSALSLDRDAGRCRLEFAVRDSGIGIPPEARDRLFKPFSQVDASTTRKFGGTGLGLSISVHLAELMGGAIDVESSPGLGSTFFVEVELGIAPDLAEDAESGKAAAEGRKPPPQGAGRSSLRVLVVEDNAVNQRVCERMLHHLGCRDVAVVADGIEAVAAVRDSRLDLILMDVSMPGMDGLEATRRIREMRGDSETPRIVGLSAAAMESDVASGLEAGMDGYLTKPLKIAELEDALDALA